MLFTHSQQSPFIMVNCQMADAAVDIVENEIW